MFSLVMNSTWIVVVIVVGLTCLLNIGIAKGLETYHLKHYETLDHLHVTSFMKRSSPWKAELIKKIHFRAFERDFHLTLKSGSPLLSSNFKARLIHKDGTSTRFALDHSRLFTGHDTYNYEFKVHGYREQSLWTLYIIETEEMYSIEPAWKLLKPKENPKNDSMVIYRMSDLRNIDEGKQYCDAGDNNRTRVIDLQTSQNNSRQLKPLYQTRGKRKKRNTKDTCLMYLVGDSDFFNKRCRRNAFVCSSTMISYFEAANEIIKRSKFIDPKDGEVFTNIGLEIRDLDLLADYENPSIHGTRRHFNEKFGGWTTNDKLDAFALAMKKTGKQYCLNHLMTENRDSSGVLGLAYVKQICVFEKLGFDEAFNSGVTSGTNKIGIRLPSLAVGLIVAHEIAHSFGARHDPITDECAPSVQEGGKYLMWRFSVRGHQRNNYHLSPCALREIGLNMRPDCLTSRSTHMSFCGNGNVDKGEECDSGAFGHNDAHPCCTSNCTLRPGAICSDSISACCSNCHIAPATTICRYRSAHFDCLATSYCSGNGTDCLDASFLPDGTDCGESHKCIQGACTHPCKLMSLKTPGQDLEPCVCESGNQSCLWCCFDKSDKNNVGECKPISSEIRKDGTACIRGFCKSGICESVIVPAHNRGILEAYLGLKANSTFRELMRSNIVLVIIVLSLILWIPPSIYINSKDREELRFRDEMADLYKVIQDEFGSEDDLSNFRDDDIEQHYNSKVSQKSKDSSVASGVSDVTDVIKVNESKVDMFRLRPCASSVDKPLHIRLIKTGNKTPILVNEDPGVPSKGVPRVPSKAVPGVPSKATIASSEEPSVVFSAPPSKAPPSKRNKASGVPSKGVPGVPLKDVPGVPSKGVPRVPSKAVPGVPSKATVALSEEPSVVLSAPPSKRQSEIY